MIYEVLKEIRNVFPDVDNSITGEFTISGGTITPIPTMNNKQYLLIEGSAMNDGVYRRDDLTTLVNETFRGTITPLKIPRDLLNIIEEIEAFQGAQGAPSAFTSESFGGYSYSRATTASGQFASWKTAFGSRLNSWRKV